MGCGASAVREEVPQSGPVGSAASLARWKRNQPSQTKIVECSLPTVKGVQEEVETNCGESSLGEACSEAPSRPVSRESTISDQTRDQLDNRSTQLRLQVSKACVLAAQSGALAAALQQVRSSTQPKAPCITAPSSQPNSRRPSRKKPQTQEADPKTEELRAKEVLENGMKKMSSESEAGKPTEDIEVIKAKAVACLEGVASNPRAFDGLLAAKAQHEAAQQVNMDISSIRKRAAERLELMCGQGTLESMLEESMKATSRPGSGACSKAVSKEMTKSSDDLEAIRQKAVSILEKAVDSGMLDSDIGPRSSSSSSPMTTGTNGEDIELIRQRAASCLAKAAESGCLEKAMIPMTKVDDDTIKDVRLRIGSSILKAAASGSLDSALSIVFEKKQAEEMNRERVRSCLETCAWNGSLENAVGEALKSKTQHNDEIERIRQKTKAVLEGFLQANP